jgi:hypothetical protein
MSTEQNDSNTTAPTQFLQVSNETYAYRRFGSGTKTGEAVSTSFISLEDLREILMAPLGTDSNKVGALLADCLFR